MTKIKNKHIILFIISTLLVFLIFIIIIPSSGCRLISSDDAAKTDEKTESYDTAGQAEEGPENVTGKNMMKDLHQNW